MKNTSLMIIKKINGAGIVEFNESCIIERLYAQIY